MRIGGDDQLTTRRYMSRFAVKAPLFFCGCYIPEHGSISVRDNKAAVGRKPGFVSREASGCVARLNIHERCGLVPSYDENETAVRRESKRLEARRLRKTTNLLGRQG